MFTTSTLVVLLPAKKPVIIRMCCDYLAYLIIYQYKLMVDKKEGKKKKIKVVLRLP
jgi:hypothetical protein